MPRSWYGTTVVRSGADAGERARQQHRWEDRPDRVEHGIGHQEGDGRENRRGQDQPRQQAKRLRGVTPIGRVVEAADERQRDEHGDAADRCPLRPAERAEAVLLLEEDVADDRHREESESEGGEGKDRRPDRADLQESSERRLHRYRRRAYVLHDLAENVLLLELTARRFRQPEGEPRSDGARNSQKDECPSPTR